MPHSQTPHRPAERGSAMLLAMVLIVILAVVGLSVASRSSAEAESAGAKRQLDKSVSCADAARELLISQFRTFGVTPTSLVLNTPVEDKVLATGHYDNIAVTSVTGATGAAGAGIGASDMSNRIARTRLGGQFYRMTVMCATMGAGGVPSRQSEVEYVVRFGI